MKFGPVPVAEASGAILAHSKMINGRKIPKGTVLTDVHVAEMTEAGVTEIVVARLEQGDIHEDVAAQQLAEALCGPDANLEVGKAGTGRVNLRAPQAGILEIDAAAINACNAINPGITIATVPEWHKLATRGLAATIKIIPYAVHGNDLQAACGAAFEALRLRLPMIRTAILIETRTGEDDPPEKGRNAMRDRLAQFGVNLSDRIVVPHQEAAIAKALSSSTADLHMILTASATSDLRDTAPEAVRLAGGQVDHYGMPVDPGNLLFIGSLNDAPVLGLPGCARSPALNGADWVLERLICGVPVNSKDIVSMGVGGLLKEIPSRPLPRAKVDR